MKTSSLNVLSMMLAVGVLSVGTAQAATSSVGSGAGAGSGATAGGSLGMATPVSPGSSTASPAGLGTTPSTAGTLSGSTAGTLSGSPTTTAIPPAGTSAGSPQNAGPLNAAPNGAGGTYGYPNAAIDPNTTNPGIPQQPYFGSPYYGFSNGNATPLNNGTTSGTSMSINPMGAPFVVPPGSVAHPATP